MTLITDEQWFKIGPEFVMTVGFVLAGAIALLATSASRGVRTNRSAWSRAIAYFGACWLAGWAAGVTPAIFADRPVNAQQLSSLNWWAWFAAAVGVIIVAYGVIWPQGTITHGRPLQAGWAITFGLLWGLSQGQLYLSFWSVTERVFGSGWVAGILVWIVISAFTGVWHDKYWDRLVSPEHNLVAWNPKKVAFCHVPNLVVTLLFLGVYENALIFVLLQTLALVLSCWFMRFPGPRTPAGIR